MTEYGTTSATGEHGGNVAMTASEEYPENDAIDVVKLANAILAVGVVPGIFRGPKRWSWALAKAREIEERMRRP